MWKSISHGANLSRGSVQDYILAGGFMSAPAWMPTISDINEYLPLASFLFGVFVGLHRVWVDRKRAKPQR